MVAFPKFWIRTSTTGISGSDSDGKKCWWISDKQVNGFRVHPAFKRSTIQTNGTYNTIDWVYIGRYDGSVTNIGNKEVISSKKGKNLLNDTTRQQQQQQCLNRNDGSNTGWRPFDIWDLSILRILSLIAKLSANSRETWGGYDGPDDRYPLTGETESRICFKGDHSNPTVSIEDLWNTWWLRIYSYWTDNNRLVHLTSPMDNTTDLEIRGDKTHSPQGQGGIGYMHDVLSGSMTIGNDSHNLMEVFAPKSTTMYRGNELAKNAAFVSNGLTYNEECASWKTCYYQCFQGAGVYWRDHDGLYAYNSEETEELGGLVSRIAKS